MMIPVCGSGRGSYAGIDVCLLFCKAYWDIRDVGFLEMRNQIFRKRFNSDGSGLLIEVLYFIKNLIPNFICNIPVEL